MAHPTTLILIGYWDGPQTDHSWPTVEQFVDTSWDAEERDTVAEYLSTGPVFIGFMGISRCRFCGGENGSVERTDGLFVWPEGLAHYVTDHAVRLPIRFVEHVTAIVNRIETADRDVDWWRGFRV